MHVIRFSVLYYLYDMPSRVVHFQLACMSLAMVLSTYNKKSHLIEGFGYIYTTILVSGSKNVKKHYCKKKRYGGGIIVI